MSNINKEEARDTDSLSSPAPISPQGARVVHVFLHHPKIRGVRMKDRFCTLSSAGGWRDFMYNFFLLDDPNQHICELQVSHHQLLTARKGECARSSRVILLLLLMCVAVTNTYTATLSLRCSSHSFCFCWQAYLAI